MRHVERETVHMCSSTAEAGRFLQALAEGADALWPDESNLKASATTVRTELITVLGVPRANALLRSINLHGRLFPGLAPELKGPVVGTDELQATPSDQVKSVRSALLQKMLVGGHIDQALIGKART